MGKQLIFDEKLAWKTTDELGSPKDFGDAIYALFAAGELTEVARRTASPPGTG